MAVNISNIHSQVFPVGHPTNPYKDRVYTCYVHDDGTMTEVDPSDLATHNRAQQICARATAAQVTGADRAGLKPVRPGEAK